MYGNEANDRNISARNSDEGWKTPTQLEDHQASSTLLGRISLYHPASFE